MPHDVIMPALGMAQETGKIIAWLKQPGDAVAEGDPLFEVETDKAAMEVEAQADGFLGQVSASAGEDVPVGQVVAIIADSAEEAAAAGSAAAPASAQAEPEGADGDSLPEGENVIMPALGMAQDTGLIVSWAKQPGDPVAADDILLEVETDKSVMEVTAGHDGFVAAILAEAQQAVPVGSVIAVISQARPSAPLQRRLSEKPAAAPEQDAAPVPPPQPVPAAPSPRAPAAAAPQAGGRILASPKARRIAVEEGLDLALLAAHGVPQPFHVADLEKLRALATSQLAATGPGVSGAILNVSARVSAEGFDDFIAWLDHDGGTKIAPRLAWLRFAGAALRDATGMEDDTIVVELRNGQAPEGRFADPDHVRIASRPAEADGSAPDLVMRDFTGTAVLATSARAGAAPVLTVSRDGGSHTITLDYREDRLSEAQAFSLVDTFAGRLADPLRHLL
ncbi:biotin/lipoyl-containing protein [Zhengella sp. ZM62]|uniref:biotin/lipoyl-containing protein n=1 Tax=Zhengella sedimenti TaxID=3390035 RepID=UPI0039760BBF